MRTTSKRHEELSPSLPFLSLTPPPPTFLTGNLSPGTKTATEEILETLRQDSDVDVRRAAGANVPLLPDAVEDDLSGSGQQ